MPARIGLSKKQRFDVFKRDAFACQYCGRTPPTVVLEADHITAVSKGGTNDPHNLITSCFDCNRGKGVNGVGGIPLDTKEKVELLEERLEQARAYDRLLRKQRSRQDAEITKIVWIYEESFGGWTLLATAKGSIRRFLERLPTVEVEDAMTRACSVMNRDKAFKYFCGICWKKIKEPQ